ncbi:MAG: hypothetical protein J6H18_00180 [Lachnospiraceae bacterium]|nr:hypothetical protein [Lachnospiraceae bacterium]
MNLLKRSSHSFSLKKPPLLLAAAFVLSLLFLLVGSKSSPLYPMNDNVDLNVYMTVGREMLAGRVPYRDLFEQKGPLLFMLHAFLALFFRSSYFGVYLLEVLCFALFLYYSGKICALYVKNRLFPYLVMLFLGIAFPLAPSFMNTGSMEEIYLFAFVMPGYFVLRALREDRCLSFRENLLIGLLAGYGFWTKYTFCGFFAALALFVVLWYISRKRFRPLAKTAGQMLLGLGIATLPVLLYFLATGALPNLIQAYFTDNMTLYSQTAVPGLKKVWDSLVTTLRSNRQAYGWLFIPGGLYLLLGLWKHWRESLFVLLAFAGLAITTYINSPGYSYYGLSLAPFSLCGLVGLAWGAEKLLLYWGIPLDALSLGPSRRAALLLGLGALLLTGTGMLAIRFFSSSAYLMDYSREELPQYQFAQTIRQTPDATLLNYWFLDGGFYYISGAVPVNRYFCFFNINPPDLKPEQENVILNAEVDYVVCRRDPLPERLLKEKQYELVQTANFFFSTRYYNYYLYKRVVPPSSH